MYTLDVYRDGMETVVVRHPPRFGATVASVDDAQAMRVNGVLAVRIIPQGVAVYATNTWAALKGREALEIEWDTSGAETRSSEAMMATWREATATRAAQVESRGDIDAPAAEGARTLEAVYEFPFLAHAPMEPLDGVIEWTGDGAEVWMDSQLQTADHGAIAATLGIPQASVTLHTMFAGGSFGRRAQGGADFAAELAAVAKASDAGVPLKLVWTREDDVRGGRYRPLTVHRLKGAVDADGRVTHWENTIATQSIMAGTPFEAMMSDGIDPTSHEGSSELPYDFPNVHVSLATMESKVPVLRRRQRRVRGERGLDARARALAARARVHGLDRRVLRRDLRADQGPGEVTAARASRRCTSTTRATGSSAGAGSPARGARPRRVRRSSSAS